MCLHANFSVTKIWLKNIDVQIATDVKLKKKALMNYYWNWEVKYSYNLVEKG